MGNPGVLEVFLGRVKNKDATDRELLATQRVPSAQADFIATGSCDVRRDLCGTPAVSVRSDD